MIKNSLLKGFTASILLIFIYFALLTFVSGWQFAQTQFLQFWYFIIALSLGFGLQVGLYFYLKNKIKDNSSFKMVGVSGATSTFAMVSCCSHYLANLLPILGAVGIVTIIAQYQIQIFWVGLGFNLIGILYISNRIIRLQSSYEK